MKKLYFVLSFILLSFSSCFEAVEELDMNSDGSGLFTFTLNLSQSKLELNAIQKLDSIKGVKVPSNADIRKHFGEIGQWISSSGGIRKYNHTLDLENYIVVIKINFDSIPALTTALKQAYKKKTGKEHSLKDDLIPLPAGLERLSYLADYGILGKVDKEKRAGLSKATYTCVYRFGSTVKSVSNKEAKVSSNKKAVFIKATIQELLNKEKTLSNKIILTE